MQIQMDAKNWISQLTMFMALDLLFFPLGIGMLLDLALLPLFPGGSLKSHIALLKMYPVGALFITWLGGTMFVNFCLCYLYTKTNDHCRFMFFLADCLAHIRKAGLFVILCLTLAERTSDLSPRSFVYRSRSRGSYIFTCQGDS